MHYIRTQECKANPWKPTSGRLPAIIIPTVLSHLPFSLFPGMLKQPLQRAGLQEFIRNVPHCINLAFLRGKKMIIFPGRLHCRQKKRTAIFFHLLAKEDKTLYKMDFLA
jgi:hypothetical protein